MMTVARRGSYKLLNSGKEKLKEKLKVKKGENGDDEEADGDGDGCDVSEGSNVGGNKKKKKGGYAVTRFYIAGVGNLSLSPPLVLVEEDNHRGESKDDDAVDEIAVLPKTAIVFQPHTGKTHQLRVASKSVSLPIMGDVRYGGGRLLLPTATDRCSSDFDDAEDALDDALDDDDATTHNDSSDWDRTYLHASAIHFQWNGEDVTIYSPPPFDHLCSTTNRLTNVFVSLMEKHCDCLPIMNVIREREEEVAVE